MEGEEWRKVHNHKKQRQRFRQKEKKNDKVKWEILKEEIPHIVMPSRAFRLRKKLNIDLLDKCLLSDEVIEHQRKGWIYEKVVKPDDKLGIPNDDDSVIYSVLDIGNRWGDTVLFKMEKS